MSSLVDSSDLRSLSRHSWIGLLSIVVLSGGLGLWAANVEIAGAVVAGGTVVVQTYAKSVQHQEGGTVREILVHNEDAVQAGQLLVRLDDTALSANLAVIQAQLVEGLAQEARLSVEVGGGSAFVVPEELLPTGSEPDVAGAIETQRQMLTTELADRDGHIAQLGEQITQLERQIEGFTIQKKAVETQIAIIQGEMADLGQLRDRQLIEASRVTTLGKSLAVQQGEQGRLIAAIAEAGATIAERRLQMEQVGTDFVSTALGDLQKARQAIVELRQQKRAALEKLGRTEIRAPQDGIVHESVVHTVGGVVGPGEVLMEIVPQSDVLMVDIRVDPMDIDSLAVRQQVVLRLSSFDQRRTPEINGSIEAISPDHVQDRASGREYYTARITIEKGELDRLPPDVRLRPGMPVQAFVTTENRSVLSYLLHPFIEELNLAFREQ